MPWRFTSLYDSTYLPDIDADVSDKLNLFFRYRYVHSIENLYDEFKNLIIEHKDGDILEYKIYNVMKYATVNGHRSFWKHFVSSVDCGELDLCKSKIDKMTDETDEMATEITHLSYHPNGKFKSVTLHDSAYNLIDYSSNDSLRLVNDLCKTDPGTFNGLITLYPESEGVTFNFMLNYAPYSVYPYRAVDKRVYECGVATHTNKFHNDRFKRIFLEKEILNQEQVDYIDTVISDNTRFDLEYDINEDGSINDIYLLNYRIYDFKDLTTV
jgi:hypothetical protein